jgi:hypothetical protein
MRLRIDQAIELARKRGLVAYSQRGFYSHFLRVRTADYQTLGTPDLVRNTISRRSLMRVFEKDPRCSPCSSSAGSS